MDAAGPTRVVVTGATGFIGRHVTNVLIDRGYEVHCLGRSTSSVPGARPHAIDLIREDPAPLLAAIAPMHLLHLAWYAEHGRFWNAPENLDWVAASLRLVRGFAAAGGQRLTVAGSCAEYDWDTPCLDEERTPLRPRSLYGISKNALHQVVAAAAPDLGLSLAWGRIFFPFGGDEPPGKLLGSLLTAQSSGATAAFSAGTQERDFLYAGEVARALVALLLSDVSGAVNIASGEAVSVRDFVHTAASLTNMTNRVSFGDRPLQTGEPPRLVAATRRLRDEVGFTPRGGLAEGLADAIRERGDRLDG